MKRKPALVWDEWNKQHCKKHGLSNEEAEEAYKNSFLDVSSYGGRRLYYGRTKTGRLLGVAVSFEKQKQPYPVSVRPMSNKERKLYL